MMMPRRLIAVILITPVILCGLSRKTAFADPTGIRSIDWRNFQYTRSPDSLVGTPDQAIFLHNGKAQATTPDDFEISRLTAVRYADFLGDGHTEAAIEVVTPVASRRAEEDNIYVFDWHNGHPRQIFFQMYESGAKIQVSGRSLLIFQPDAFPPDPVHWTQRVLRWHAGKFHTVLSKSVY